MTLNLRDKINKFLAQLKKSLFEHPKTTISGIVGASGYVGQMFGMPIPDNIAQGMVGLGVALVGIMSSDGGREA